jgi:hypothetical protein
LAAVAGFGVTPVVAAVDKALAENASGKAKLWPSFFSSLAEAMRSPWQYVKSPQFRWIWLSFCSHLCFLFMRVIVSFHSAPF